MHKKFLMWCGCWLLVWMSFNHTAEAQAPIPAAPDTVKIGCYVISLHDFNFRDKEYIARFWLWLLYDNEELDFDDDVEVPNAKEIHFDEVLIDSLDHYKWVQMKMRCIMKQSWRVRDYPFDHQNLKIVVENAMYDARTMVFSPDTIGKFYDPELTLEGWKITDFNIHTGISQYATGFGDTSLTESEYGKFTIDIRIERDAWGLFLKVFLGMYVSFAIAFVSFFIDAQHIEPRFGLPVGGLFGAVGNKYVIDSFLPETSELTLVDMLHGITFVFLFVITAFSALSLRYEDEGKLKKSEKTDRLMAWLLGIIYVVLNLILIMIAIYR